MDWISSEILIVLRFLLPGLVAAWIFYALTSYARPSEFERIIQALIFTTIVQGLTVVIFTIIEITKIDGALLKNWKESGLSDVISLTIAILFGLWAARFANNDQLHSVLRALGFTKETSYPSEWFGAFSQQKRYVVLHITGERRLYGWPEEWPSDPNTGHFSVAEAEWLTDTDRIPLENVVNFLVPATEVTFVEFMSKVDNQN